MANLKFSNFGKAKLAIAPVGTGGLTFTVASGKGALYPVLGAGEYFYGIFKDASGNREIVKIEARSGDLMTIASGGRGIDGTTARTWLVDDYFVGGLTRIALDEFIQSVTTQAIGATSITTDNFVYFDTSTTAAVTPITSLARTLLGDATTAAMRATLDAVSKTAAETIGGKKTFSASIVQAVAGDVTAAATINLTTAVGNMGDIIGNTGITAVTLEDGKWFLATFASNPLLTHHATNLNINNGGDNYQTVAGDSVLFHADSGITYGKIFKKNPPASGLIGEIKDYAGTSLPSDFLECDGAEVSRSTYASLFTAIGTTWGAGNGTTTFDLPDFRRRTAVGKGGTGSGQLGNAVGNTGGEEDHALTEAENAAHTHITQLVGLSAGGFSGISANTSNSKNNAGTPATGSSGSGTAHNTMQPSAVVMKIIRYQ